VQATLLFLTGLDTYNLEVYERLPSFADHPHRTDFQRDSGKFQQGAGQGILRRSGKEGADAGAGHVFHAASLMLV
jgi:hypothetical protein